MPVVSIPKLKKTIEVSAGTNLMDILLKADLPVASSCDGEGVCAKCRIRIISGSENLSPINSTEEFLRENNNIPKDFRISCQTQITGNIEIEATYW